MLLYLECYKNVLSKGANILLGQPECQDHKDNNDFLQTVVSTDNQISQNCNGITQISWIQKKTERQDR